MAERKETSGFLTLEEMRDELDRRTSKKQNKEEAFAQTAVEDKPDQVTVADLTAEEEPTEKIVGISQNKKESSVDIKSIEERFLGKEDTQTLTEEEKKIRSKEKLQEFLSQGSKNIYSHSESDRGPYIFQTGSFSDTKRMTSEEAKAFRDMKISDTMVNRYQDFKAQRVKKAENFQLNREENSDNEEKFQTRRVRPLYAEPTEEQMKSGSELEVQKGTSNEDSQELEYNSCEDKPAVSDYLSKLKKNFTVVSIALASLTAVSVVWILLLMIAPSCLPVIFLPDRAVTYLTGWLILLAVSVVFGWDILKSGLKGLTSFKANCDSPVSLAVAGSLLQLLILYFSGNRLTADGNVFVLAPIAIECLLIHSVGRLMLVNRAVDQFKNISENDNSLYASGIIANEELAAAFTRGKIHHRPFVGFCRKSDFPSDFMYYTFLEDQSDLVGYFVAPISLCLAFVFFAVSSIITADIFVGLTLFAAVLCISGSSNFFVGLQAPLFLAHRRLKKYDANLLGYESTVEFGELNATMITAQKLFPEGTVRLCGMRTFNHHPIDDSILCAASILKASNSVLRDMFMEVLLGRTDLLKPVDSVLFEDGLGISGWVGDRHIVIGSRDMAINHNIPVLSKEEEQAVCPEGMDMIYVSVSGELTAVFIFSLFASEETENILTNLMENDIVVVVQTVDPVITVQKLSDIFGIDEDLFKILPARFHKAYRNQVEPVEKTNSPVLNNGTFASFAASLIGAKRLKKTVMLTTVFSLAGAALGILMLLMFTVMQKLVMFSAPQLILLQAAVFLLVMLVCLIRKT